jgi:hypothetical protein
MECDEQHPMCGACRWLMSEDAEHRPTPSQPTPPRDIKHGPRPGGPEDGPSASFTA